MNRRGERLQWLHCWSRLINVIANLSLLLLPCICQLSLPVLRLYISLCSCVCRCYIPPPTLQSALNWISKCSDIVTTTLPQQRFSLACFKKCNKAWNQCQSAEQIVLLLTKGLLKEVILRGTKSKYAAAFMCPLSPVQEIRVFFFPAISPSMCVKRAAALPRFKKVKVSDKRSLYYWLCWEIITLEGFATLHAHDNCTHNNMIDHSNIGTHKKTFFFFLLKASISPASTLCK